MRIGSYGDVETVAKPTECQEGAMSVGCVVLAPSTGRICLGSSMKTRKINYITCPPSGVPMRSISILLTLCQQLLSITSSAQEDSKARRAANPTLPITATSTIKVVSVLTKVTALFFKHYMKTSVNLQAQFYNSEADGLITLAYERLRTTLNSCQRIIRSILSGSINDSILDDRVLHFTVTRHSLASRYKGIALHCASPVIQAPCEKLHIACRKGMVHLLIQAAEKQAHIQTLLDMAGPEVELMSCPPTSTIVE